VEARARGGREPQSVPLHDGRRRGAREDGERLGGDRAAGSERRAVQIGRREERRVVAAEKDFAGGARVRREAEERRRGGRGRRSPARRFGGGDASAPPPARGVGGSAPCAGLRRDHGKHGADDAVGATPERRVGVVLDAADEAVHERVALRRVARNRAARRPRLEPVLEHAPCAGISNFAPPARRGTARRGTARRGTARAGRTGPTAHGGAGAERDGHRLGANEARRAQVLDGDVDFDAARRWDPAIVGPRRRGSPGDPNAQGTVRCGR
jgi:hypothetical protein